MKCISCKKKEAIEYEQVGIGKYCLECLNKQIKIWEMEAGFDK